MFSTRIRITPPNSARKLRDLKTNPPNYTPSGKGKGRQKGKGKTKGKGNRSDKPTWKPGPNKGSNPKGKGRGRGRGTGTEVTCSHCHKVGHEARDCFTRKREMNQTTTNFSLTNTTQDEKEIPIEFRNYVTFVKRPREESDLTLRMYASWQDDETPPSTPPSEEDMTSSVRDNTENDTQEESSSNPEPGNDKGKFEHEGSSSNLLLEPVHPSTWQSRYHHQPDGYDPLDWGRGKIMDTLAGNS